MDIELNTPVLDINYEGDSIIVTAGNGNTYEADKVIVTVPLGVL
jgi:monoamine oxidase